MKTVLCDCDEWNENDWIASMNWVFSLLNFYYMQPINTVN